MTVLLTIVLTLLTLLIIGGAYLMFRLYKFLDVNLDVTSQCYQLLHAMAQYRAGAQQYEEIEVEEGTRKPFGLNDC